MSTIRTLIAFANRVNSKRFDAYYINVARSGAGYPTADEARKDLRNAQPPFYGWTR